jgi:hypothetical protein
MADELFARTLHAITDVQRRSADAAGQLVERLIASVDGDGDRDATSERDGTPTGTDDAIAGMTRLWRDSITTLASALTGGTDTGARIDVAATAPPAAVVVTLDAASGTGSTEVWLHNPSALGFDKLRLHCAPAVAHDGSVLDAAVATDPDGFDLPARSSRGVLVSIDAPDATPGVYRSLLLVDGLAEQWLPLEVVVPERA